MAERMGSLMCVDVDVDVSLDAEDEAEVNDERDVVETLESEVREAKENGDGTLRWLELEGLHIDDDMLVSLALPTRFPVCSSLFLIHTENYFRKFMSVVIIIRVNILCTDLRVSVSHPITNCLL